MSIINLPNELLYFIGELLVTSKGGLVSTYYQAKKLFSRDRSGILPSQAEHWSWKRGHQLDTRSLASLLRTNHKLNVALTPLLNRIMLNERNDLLLWAAGTRNEPLARRLLDNGADIHTTDAWENTPLHQAAKGGDEQLVRLLLDRGASTTARVSDKRCTPLHYAAVGGSPAIVKLLVENGADINAQEHNGATAVRLAALEGGEDVVRLLVLGYGANLSLTDRYAKTPLHWVASYGTPAMVELLLQGGADINARCLRNKSPLDLATAFGREAVVRKLVESGASVQNRSINRAMRRAVASGCEYEAQLYLDNGVDPDNWTADSSEINLLHLAYISRKEGVMKLLLERGADPNALHQGQSILHKAARDDRPASIDVLLNGGTDIELPCSCLNYAAFRGNAVTGQTALHIAAARETTSCAELLLKNGANPNARDSHGKTPLHTAAQLLHSKESFDTVLQRDTVGLLLDNGADINARGADGMTVLHEAAWFAMRTEHITEWEESLIVRWGEFLMLLVDNGVDVDAKDGNGRTAVGLMAATPDLQAVTIEILEILV